MEKQKILGLSVLGVLSVLICGGLVTAYMADRSMGNRGKGPMMGADLEDLDLPEDATREQVREAVRARQMEELDLPEDATDEEIRAAMNEKREERQAKLDAAIEAGDYAAWKALVLETGQGESLTELITEENFGKYAEMQEYLQKADELAEELGLSGKGKGMGPGGFGRSRGGCPPNGQTE